MSNTIFDDYLNGLEALFGIKIIYPTKPLYTQVELPLDSPVSSTATIEAEPLDEDEERLMTDETLEPETLATHPNPRTTRYLFRTFVGKWEIKRNNM